MSNWEKKVPVELTVREIRYLMTACFSITLHEMSLVTQYDEIRDKLSDILREFKKTEAEKGTEET